jgi:hypothetical protein
LGHALKSGPLVAAITERLPIGVAASAQPEGGATRKSILLSFLIYELDFTIHNQRAVIGYRNLGWRHSNLSVNQLSFLP